jgi:hypothetical protein
MATPDTTRRCPEILAAECGSGSIVRPRYSQGILLTDDDLKAAVDYTGNLTRLLFRHLLGCGVVCGLEVTVDNEKVKRRCLVVTVGSGLAIDCQGNPIELKAPQSLSYAPDCDNDLPAEAWVVLCGTERRCAPRELACPPEDAGDTTVSTRIVSGWKLQLLPQRPEHACPPPTVSPPSPAATTGTGGGTTSPAGGSGVQLTSGATTTLPSSQQPSPSDGYYKAHAEGRCSSCDGCGCGLLLARVAPDPDGAGSWAVHHGVRRFIRPVLLSDPKLPAPGTQAPNPGRTDTAPPTPPVISEPAPATPTPSG